MNGPDHYLEAERLAGPTGEWYYADTELVPAILARAQVHATLALAAATALAAPDYTLPEIDGSRWFYVAGTKPPTCTDDDAVVEAEIVEADEDSFPTYSDNLDATNAQPGWSP